MPALLGWYEAADPITLVCSNCGQARLGVVT